jgi:hypothetical protein
VGWVLCLVVLYQHSMRQLCCCPAGPSCRVMAALKGWDSWEGCRFAGTSWVVQWWLHHVRCGTCGTGAVAISLL